MELQHTVWKMSSSGSMQHIHKGGLDVKGEFYGLLRWILSCGDTWRSMFLQSLPELPKILWQNFRQLRRWWIPICWGVFKRTSCGVLLSVLKWTEAASNIRCNYNMPMIWSFNNFRHEMVTCIVKTKHHRTYIVHIYDLQLLCSVFHPVCIIPTRFQRLDAVSVFRWNLLSSAQSIELVPIAGTDGDRIQSP
jgi:hypothetical protein